MASHLLGLARGKGVHRVIVAMPDRRGTLPVEELLDLRLGRREGGRGDIVAGEDFGQDRSRAVVPQLADLRGRVPFQQFLPAAAPGAEFFGGADGTVISLPLLPFIVLAVKLDSPGRSCTARSEWGGGERIFYCYKFRTMRVDAEADTGATWASDDDPRITRVGKFLRSSRLDEIPQLWCVLKGDMHFVGPRPERPEFVEWLSREIPYYGVRHVVRPGITGLGAGAIQVRQHA